MNVGDHDFERAMAAIERLVADVGPRRPTITKRASATRRQGGHPRRDRCRFARREEAARRLRARRSSSPRRGSSPWTPSAERSTRTRDAKS